MSIGRDPLGLTPAPTPDLAVKAPASDAGIAVANPPDDRRLAIGLPASRSLFRWAPFVASGVMLLAGLWQVGRLSYTQDEAATLSAVRRPFGSMLAVLGHIDAVHGAYYLLLHLLVRLGTSAEVVRMPSVLAMAVAAYLTTLLGIRLAGDPVGLVAGLLFALSPLTAEYAQDARPFAMVTCLAVLASYRFAIFAKTGSRKHAVWYGVALAACGLMNVFGLLIIAGHTVTLLGSPVRRDRLRRFAWATGAAVLAVSPVGLLAATEVSQVGWEHGPSGVVVLGVLVTLAVAGLVAWRTARSSRDSDFTGGDLSDSFGHAALTRLSAPWLIIPVALLLAASQIPVSTTSGGSAGTGIWEPRYLLFCFPALVLLLSDLASRLPSKVVTALTAIMIIASASSQALARPNVSPDDLRAVAALLEARSHTGDAVVFPNIAKRLITDAYPSGFSRLTDIGLNSSPAARDSLYGLNVSQPVLWRRLARARVQRLWMVIFPVPRPEKYYPNATAPDEFCLKHSWQFPLNMVLLYHRCRVGVEPVREPG
jgi:mannosyltransferase